MKNLVGFFFLFLSTYSYSQLESVIINSETRESIPYVNIWVEGQNIGTTSNESGTFHLSIDTTGVFIFSAIGYETRKISSDLIENTVELKPSVSDLEEVVVIANPKDLELTIGKFKKPPFLSGFSCGGKPCILARRFLYQESFSKTRRLDKIKLLTTSDVRDAKFNIRLYHINEDGEPGKYIYNENIIGIARKGKGITEIDLSKFNLQFPESGLFVGFEWLILESNKYETTYTIEGSKKKLKGIDYEPGIVIVSSDTVESSWWYRYGKWTPVWKNSNDAITGHKEKYNFMAVELTLTN
jgi:hypothetical protein